MVPTAANATGGGHGYSGHPPGHQPSTTATGVQRDSHGKIKRSPSARRDFQRSNPCPSTGRTSGACPGYVVDHVLALVCGGEDDPSNMQWQTTAAAKAKDRIERDGCKQKTADRGRDRQPASPAIHARAIPTTREKVARLPNEGSSTGSVSGFW